MTGFLERYQEKEFSRKRWHLFCSEFSSSILIEKLLVEDSGSLPLLAYCDYLWLDRYAGWWGAPPFSACRRKRFRLPLSVPWCSLSLRQQRQL